MRALKGVIEAISSKRITPGASGPGNCDSDMPTVGEIPGNTKQSFCTYMPCKRMAGANFSATSERVSAPKMLSDNFSVVSIFVALNQ